jgi:hypothetical protein
VNTRNEIIKRYMYLYQNKELILALCIGTGIEKEKLEKKIKESERLLSSNSVYNRELMKLELEKANYDLEHEKYYLMANVNDSIVDMYEDFLFSDKEMEELDLYKHIEGVKNSKYLDVFNTLIENLETRRKRNFYLKKVPTFTVWKILSYVRRKNIDNRLVLDALDKYYNIDRFMLTGDNYESGYKLLESDIYRLGEGSLVKYPSTILMTGGIINDFENNSFEIEDDYYDGLFELSCIEEMSLMSNLSVQDKESIKSRLETGKKLVK